MTTITPPDYTASAGIPAQSSDTINITPEGLLSGDMPALLTTDMTFAYNQTILARTPVGFDANGDLVPASSGAGASMSASGQLTFSGVGTANDTITVGSVTYTLKAAPTVTANEVKIGASAAETATNLVAAINGGAGSGTLYGSATVAHPDVTARIDGAGIVGIVANVPGAAGNAIASTEAGSNTSFGAATLANGRDAAGVVAVGITVIAVTTPGSGTKKAAPVYRGGCFNPAMINWPASFDTTAEKINAFRGAPSPTQIVIRPVQTASVTLP